MEKKVSIIVPVYKVERYLSECIDSLLCQSYKNLEIILIDDESPDQCPKICDEYAIKDTRVLVIHQQNGGAGKARNSGLKKATGKYVCFVDSDDLVHRDYVKRLVSMIELEKADIAVCSYYYLYKNGREKQGYKGLKQVISQKEYLLRYLDDWTCSLIWNKIFKRKVIGNLCFVEGHKIDDEFFTYQAVMKSKSIVLFDEPLYEYRMRASSVMKALNQYEQDILKDKLEYLIQRYNNVTTMFPEIKMPYLKDLANNLIILWRKSIKYPEYRRLVSKEINQYRWEIVSSKIDFKMKCSFLYAIYFEKDKMHEIILVEDNVEDNLFE